MIAFLQRPSRKFSLSAGIPTATPTVHISNDSVARGRQFGITLPGGLVNSMGGNSAARWQVLAGRAAGSLGDDTKPVPVRAAAPRASLYGMRDRLDIIEML